MVTLKAFLYLIRSLGALGRPCEASDEEGRQLQEERRAQVGQLELLEVRFPVENAEVEATESLKERLRSQFEAKKAAETSGRYRKRYHGMWLVLCKNR